MEGCDRFPFCRFPPMSEPSEGPNDGATTLVFHGPVTRSEVAKWHGLLVSAFAKGPVRPVRLDLTASGPWDLAGLQLLLAAMISARKVGREFILQGPPSVLRELAERAGASALLAPAWGETQA